MLSKFSVPSGSVELRVTDGSLFEVASNVLVTGSIVHLLTSSAVNNQRVVFDVKNADYPFEIWNAHSSSIFTNDIRTFSRVEAVFNGSDWVLHTFSTLEREHAPAIGQDPILYNKDLVIDIDPTKFYAVDEFENEMLKIVSTWPSDLILKGIGHTPQLDIGSIKSDVPSITSRAQISYLPPAVEFLSSSYSQDLNDMSYASPDWGQWSIFVVYKLASTTSVSQTIFSLNQEEPNEYPLLILEANTTDVFFSTYTDNWGTGDTFYVGLADTGAHILDVHADGFGSIDGWFDGSQVITSENDVRPKTFGTCALLAHNAPGDFRGQMHGSIARYIVFKKCLSADERDLVRDHLIRRYM